MERKRLLLIGGSALILVGGVTALTVSLFSCNKSIERDIDLPAREEVVDNLFTLGKETGFDLTLTYTRYMGEEELTWNYEFMMKGDTFYYTATDSIFFADFGYRLNEDNSMDFFSRNGDGNHQVVFTYEDAANSFTRDFDDSIFMLFYDGGSYQHKETGNKVILNRNTSECYYKANIPEQGKMNRTAYIDKELGFALYYKVETDIPDLLTTNKTLEVKSFTTVDVEVPIPLPKNN